MTPRERAEARAREIRDNALNLIRQFEGFAEWGLYGGELPDRSDFKRLAEVLVQQMDRADAAERRADGSEDGSYLLWFEDCDRGPELFSGSGARQGAWDRYRQARQVWSCHLFQRVAGEGDQAQAALRQPAQPNMGEDGGAQPVAPQGGPDAETGKSALDVLRRLMSNPSICLADKIYDVRESEGKGWDGPDVKAYGSAIKDAEALVGEWTAIANLEAEERGS